MQKIDLDFNLKNKKNNYIYMMSYLKLILRKDNIIIYSI